MYYFYYGLACMLAMLCRPNWTVPIRTQKKATLVPSREGPEYSSLYHTIPIQDRTGQSENRNTPSIRPFRLPSKRWVSHTAWHGPPEPGKNEESTEKDFSCGLLFLSTDSSSSAILESIVFFPLDRIDQVTVGVFIARTIFLPRSNTNLWFSHTHTQTFLSRFPFFFLLSLSSLFVSYPFSETASSPEHTHTHT